MKLRLQLVALALVPIVLLGTGCSRLRAKSAFRDGNKAYKDQNFRDAIEEYARAIEADPEMAEAYFYLASSHQALYRPGREGDENRLHVDEAVKNYQKALELIASAGAETDAIKRVKANTLAALTGIYSEDPYKNYEQAAAYAAQLVQDNPNDTKNLYAMANLFVKFEKFDDAERTYRQIFEQNPGDTKACGALARFYNEPFWGGKSRFDDTVATFQKCAELAPDDPAGYHTLAAFYWEKAFKDPLLTDPERLALADKGLGEIEKCLSISPEYENGLIYKGLLLRVKARFASNPRDRNRWQDQAEQISKEVERLRKEKQASASEAPPSPGS
jgi:tetratricopeptide (TPR) repeat protein